MGISSKLAICAFAISLILYTDSKFQPLQTSIGLSIIGYHVTNYLIPQVCSQFIKIGLFGKDLNKKDQPVIAETIGIIPAITYMFLMFVFIPFFFYQNLITYTSGGGNRETTTIMEDTLITGYGNGHGNGHHHHHLFPHNKLSSYLSGMLSLESMILLGLLDDLFDIRWRHKFFLPAIAAIPLLIVYYIDFGVTSILIPNFIQNWLHLPYHNIDLQFGYYVYMASVAIFCPNSINILAGVNGLEVGQTIVLAVLLLLNDLCYLLPYLLSDSIASNNSTTNPAYDSHLFSSCILIPFLGCSLALLKFNWYPSKVFVGDTFCYFSGMVFAIVGILGHFSKTLLLFFIPQIFNFIYSIPQLIGIIPCPRHRLPKFNPTENVLYPSMCDFTTLTTPLSDTKQQILKLLAKFKLIKLVIDNDEKQTIIGCNNLTLINLVLVWFGPMREDKLCAVLMMIQMIIGLIGLILRHLIGQWLFGFDNLSWT